MKVLLICYDNDSYIHYFPIGLGYIASALKNNNHDVHVYNQDMYHWSEDHLTNHLDNNDYDVVAMGIIGGYYQYAKLLKISQAIRSSKKKHIFILGGHGPSPDPKYFIEKTTADFVVIGEGDETIVDLFNNFDTPENVKGIAYIKNGQYYNTERRKLIKDIDSIPYPLWEKFPIDYYVLKREVGFTGTDRVMQMVSGRGCPYQCNFCYRMDKGFRPRSTEGIIDEIKKLKKDYYINAIEFADELLMSSVARTTEICEAFLKHDLKIKWACNGRLNFASLDLLKLMKRSGCVFINYGIESIDDGMLKTMSKNLTVKQIHEGVENTVEAEIYAGLNIIFGNIGETKEILWKGVEFIKKYGDGYQMRTIRPVTCYPGTKLFKYAIDQGLLKDTADFYENKHLNSDLITVNFTNMSDEDVYENLRLANKELISDYYSKCHKTALQQTDDLYIHLNKTFRGFRQI